jgi:hypothetical protein
MENIHAGRVLIKIESLRISFSIKIADEERQIRRFKTGGFVK